MKIIALFLSFLFFMSISTFAQRFGTDSVECVRNLTIYSNLYKSNYKEALPYWRSAWQNCPMSSENLYIRGQEMFKRLIAATPDETVREKYIDTLLMLHDQRLEYFPGKAQTFTFRKILDAVTFRNGDYQNVYNFCEKEFQSYGEETEPISLFYYFQYGVMLNKDNEKISADKVMEIYTVTSDILQKQIENASSPQRVAQINDIKKNLDDVFVKSGIANCENLTEIYTEQINKPDVSLDVLEKAVNLLSANNCTDNQIYLKACEQLYAQKPSTTLAVQIATAFTRNGDNAQAVDYYYKAMENSSTKEETARYCIMASNVLTFKLNKLEEARNLAEKALEEDPNNANAYMVLGHIYAMDKGCGDDFERSTRFWLSVDNFEKAKADNSLADEATKYINTYRAYYPTKEDLFFRNIGVGQSYTVGCWINRRTTVRVR